ncbi:MAG: hypothetical protein ACXAC8_00420 [Candidatus Hodarchaeales archaeon]|jgi:rRNA processing protein Gar1
MTREPTRIGKCSIKVQGKILVKLEGNQPKIGVRAIIKKNGKELVVGEVNEVIGSTRNPWIVISAQKGGFNLIQLEESVYTDDQPVQSKKRKKKKSRNQKRKRD